MLQSEHRAAHPNESFWKSAHKEEWDRWYASLPDDLRRRLSFHDFKRLGDCFKVAFGIT